jgi:hypothetical protein
MVLGTTRWARICAALALVLSAGCSSDKPVDCYEVPPANCEKYSQCWVIAAIRLDEQCEVEYDLLACWPIDRPTCNLSFLARDPSGQCWGLGNCFLPPGWKPDNDGSCRTSVNAHYYACFPPDSGVGTDGASAPDGGSP